MDRHDLVGIRGDGRCDQTAVNVSDLVIELYRVYIQKRSEVVDKELQKTEHFVEVGLLDLHRRQSMQRRFLAAHDSLFDCREQEQAIL